MSTSVSNPSVIAGQCYIRGQASKLPASLYLMQGGRVCLDSELGRVEYGLAELDVSEKVGSIPRQIYFPNDWVFIAADQNALDAYLDQHLSHSWLNRFESSWRWIVGGIFVTACFSLGFYKFAVPWLTDTISSHLPDSVYESAGQQTLQTLEYAVLKPSTLPEARQAQLNQHFESLISHTAQVNAHGGPKVLLRSWEKVPNAVTLADGTIIVSDQLVNLLSNDEQLDAVIYHELGHIHYAHVMKSVVKSSLISAGVALMIGDANGVADTVSSTAVFLATMHYSRELETQADEFAVTQLIEKNGKAQALKDVFTVLSHEQEERATAGLPAWLSSHPEMTERIEHIKQFEKR